jgi:hypothetical protein
MQIKARTAILNLTRCSTGSQCRLSCSIGRGVNEGNAAERRSCWCFHRRNAFPAVFAWRILKTARSTDKLFPCEHPNFIYGTLSLLASLVSIAKLGVLKKTVLSQRYPCIGLLPCFDFWFTYILLRRAYDIIKIRYSWFCSEIMIVIIVTTNSVFSFHFKL